MRRLIINADDYALTAGCSRGIVALFNQGIVTSTTILVNGEDFNNSAQLAKDNNLALGLHLCLTYGKPVAPVEKLNTLVDGEGCFKHIDILRQGRVDAKQVRIEWMAQIKKLHEAGIKPDHLDSHHYVHECLGEEIRAVALQLAKQLGVPLRQGSIQNRDYYKIKGAKTTDSFCRDFYGENATFQQLQKILTQPWQGVMELMCHPGQGDEQIEQISSYAADRQIEFNILGSRAAAQLLKEQDIKLISFADL